MGPRDARERAVAGWSILFVLAALLSALALMQYRWTGELSHAEKRTLQENLNNALGRVGMDFDLQLQSAYSSMIPSDAEVQAMGRPAAYLRHIQAWKRSGADARLFRRVAIAWNENGRPTLQTFDGTSDRLVPAAWPKNWQGMKEWVESRVSGVPPSPQNERIPGGSTLIDIPRFVQAEPAGGPPVGGEQDWLLVEVDSEYASATVLPALLALHLGEDYADRYRIEIREPNSGKTMFLSSGVESPSATSPDGAMAFFSQQMPQRMPGPRQYDGPPKQEPRAMFDKQRWRILAWMRNGSLDTLVRNSRLRNLTISFGVLVLLLGAMLALFMVSRRAQQLADAQIDFVAGISHELRTPLTVIRTAAYNLGTAAVSTQPERVEEYSKLIQRESQQLTATVNQFLQFSSAKRGQLVRTKENVDVAALVQSSLEESRGILDNTVCDVEQRFESNLPCIWGDSTALRHALNNLLSNAVWHGTSTNGGHRWIGIFAAHHHRLANPSVEIRVEDHGPGIPADELPYVFDPFYRGKSVQQSNMHGTGLGLNLVKQIVEAHGGTVSAESGPGAGTSVRIVLPAARASA